MYDDRPCEIYLLDQDGTGCMVRLWKDYGSDMESVRMIFVDLLNELRQRPIKPDDYRRPDLLAGWLMAFQNKWGVSIHPSCGYGHVEVLYLVRLDERGVLINLYERPHGIVSREMVRKLLLDNSKRKDWQFVPWEPYIVDQGFQHGLENL